MIFSIIISTIISITVLSVMAEVLGGRDRHDR